MEENKEHKVCPFGAECATCKLSQSLITNITKEDGSMEKEEKQECVLIMLSIFMSDAAIFAKRTGDIMERVWK